MLLRAKVPHMEKFIGAKVTAFIIDTVKQHKRRWIGHILRRESLLCNIMDGRILVKATRGRK